MTALNLMSSRTLSWNRGSSQYWTGHGMIILAALPGPLLGWRAPPGAVRQTSLRAQQLQPRRSE